MKLRRLGHRLISSLLAAACWSGAAGAETLDGLWTFPGAAAPSFGVALSATAIPSAESPLQLGFRCEITSPRPYEETQLRFTVRNGAGEPVGTGAILVQVARGTTFADISWDAGTLPYGKYTALIELDFATTQDTAKQAFLVKRVSGDYLRERLAALETQHRALQGNVEGVTGTTLTEERLRLRYGVADFVLETAAQAAAASDWMRLDAYVDYLAAAETQLRASLTFIPSADSGSTAPAACQEALGPLQIAGGHFVDACGDPVYLFGVPIGADSPLSPQRAAALGLNVGLLRVPPSETLAGREVEHAFASRLTEALNELDGLGLRAVVDAAPEDLGAWALEMWPEIRGGDFMDLAHPGARETLSRHLSALVPVLAGHRAVVALNLAQDPRFQMMSEAVRLQFIDYIKERNPDRINLNRKWHAHLANYEEIALSSADAHAYPNNRSFQFDWQTFHRGLVERYFLDYSEHVRTLNPGLYQMVAPQDNLFAPAETRWGIQREAFAKDFPINACTSEAELGSDFYAYHYPGQSATYTLLRSFAPEKPLLNLSNRIAVPETAPDRWNYRYVRTLLWEGVMSGVSGMVLAPDSPIYRSPDALEGYAVGAAEIMHLAKRVRDFQNAPAEVGILFSDASKILEDGHQHLKSALYAFEGSSFAGYKVRYVTESECEAGVLEGLKVLILPETPAISDTAFNSIAAYVEKGGRVARVGTPIPYNERGDSRNDVLRNTGNTVLVRGLNLPTEYLHAMDASAVMGTLPPIPRPVNAGGYPLEGVKTRYVKTDAGEFLYLVNLRKDKVMVHLGQFELRGVDMMTGQSMSLPAELPSLEPVLLRLDSTQNLLTVAAN
ncbi:MAG: hypothetical protein HYV27_06150 [Candidatus Hydrogenedentes bacterium]|nr:hypothetical protein [Candidatus Hydrogenedentota bacterium]